MTLIDVGHDIFEFTIAEHTYVNVLNSKYLQIEITWIIADLNMHISEMRQWMRMRQFNIEFLQWRLNQMLMMNETMNEWGYNMIIHVRSGSNTTAA